MAISRALRFQVLRRDQYRCHYCGATAAEAKLTVDHVTAVALGGTDTADNLVTACEPCNGGKSATPADAALVAQVQERDTRFREAVTATTDEDRQRRWFAEAFLDAWDLGELPPGWRKTIDAYQQQGLPGDIWEEIVAIARDKTNLDDPFRYCCGIARNQVKKIQTEAAQRAESSGPIDATSSERLRAAIRTAALAAWSWGIGADDEPPAAELIAAFQQSLDELTDDDFLDPGRVIGAADQCGGQESTDLRSALREYDENQIMRAWSGSWPKQYVTDDSNPWGGRFEGGPDRDMRDRVKTQVDKLLDAGVYTHRIEHAATYAGFHESGRIYRGLTDHELQASGQSMAISQAVELWRVAYRSGYGEEPSDAERDRFFKSVHLVIGAYANDEHGLLNADMWQAAAWAGAYQDPDLSTCLPLRLSVFEAAAALPVPALSN